MLCQQDSHEGIAVRNYKTLRLLQTAQSKNVGFVVNKIFFFKVSSMLWYLTAGIWAIIFLWFVPLIKMFFLKVFIFEMLMNILIY